MAQTFGPVYCETPSIIDGIFPVEPANAYSSMIIVVWGLLAAALVARQTPRSWPLIAAVVLLITNGVGSTLWHGLRTQWSLICATANLRILYAHWKTSPLRPNRPAPACLAAVAA